MTLMQEQDLITKLPDEKIYYLTKSNKFPTLNV